MSKFQDGEGEQVQSGLAAWVFAISKTLDESGISHEDLLRSLNMDPARVGDAHHRYSQEQVTSLWMAAVDATKDANFGLKVARHIRPSTFHVVGYAMSCSVTLMRAAERFSRSARLISDAARVEFGPYGSGHRLVVDLQTGGRQPIYQTIDTMLGGVLLLCEWILGSEVKPLQVTFRHAAPPDLSEYEQIFGTRILFNAPINSIVFRTADLERSIPSANEELAILLDEMTSKYLALRYTNRFSRKVRDVLDEQFASGEPSKAQTARLLSLTERTLLRRLRDENTTFQEVLDRLRQERAFDYLRDRSINIDQIAAQLGFSSSSSFSRAFMRWTGQRPSAWRDLQGVSEQEEK